MGKNFVGQVVRDDDPRIVLAWTRERVLEALADYAELYGEADLTSAAFNPSLAEWRDRPDLVKRYNAGNPLRGNKPWPSTNTVKSRFGGSFNAARSAAGLPPNRPGGARRESGKHKPNRKVEHRVIVLPAKKSRHATQARDRAEQRAVKAEARAKRLQAELDEARARVRELEQAATSMVKDLTA